MTRYRNIVWTGPLVVALLAGCSGQTATTQGSTDAQSAASWPGHPLITANGAYTEIGTERVYHTSISVLCSGSTASPTMTVTGPKGWKAVSTQPGTSGGAAKVSVTSPAGEKADFQGKDLVWTADHRLTGDGDSVAVPGSGEEWAFYTDGLTC